MSRKLKSFTCVQCGQIFARHVLHAKFCSIECSAASHPAKEYTCKNCGKVFLARRAKADFCSRPCKDAGQCGAAHPNWKGGTSITPQGYRRIAKGIGGKGPSLEHIAIAEKALGHPLPKGAVPHHWDENKSNNTPSNLVICQDHAYHMLLHARKDRFADTGSLDLKRCRICKLVKSLNEFTPDAANWDGRMYVCKKCRAAKAAQAHL